MKSRIDLYRVGGIALAVVFGLLGLFWVFKKLKKGTGYPDTPYLSNGGKVTKEFIAKIPSMLTELNKVLTDTYYFPWQGEDRCNALQRLYYLSDNQIIAVGNAYKDSYQYSLKEAILSTYRDGCSQSDPQYGELVIQKLNEVGIV